MPLYRKYFSKEVKEENGYKAICEQIVRQWQEEKLRLHPGATAQELADFEKENGLKLPDSFCYLYSLVNGMDSGSDKADFCLWSLAEIQEKVERARPEQGNTFPATEIPFGDFLIDSHRYCLATNGDNQYFVKIEGADGEKLADNFTGFLVRYLSEPEKIYLW